MEELDPSLRRDVKIKARVEDVGSLVLKAMAIAKPEAMIHQTDTFFGTTQGLRLNLRVETRGTDHINSYLMLYNIPNQKEDAKTPILMECKIPEPTKFMLIMTASNGIYGHTVDKIRRVFIHTDEASSIRTRIHIDHVHVLGDFMELEVLLPSGINESVGKRIVEELKVEMGIKDENLVDCTYFDLLQDQEKIKKVFI